ncbi:type II secretion system protein [Acetobacterium sp.]|uniref:type II secretion system protein n=1 Tax=Acetobacterium sp. TaxID=1872094 RepID=UPI002F41D2C2
MKFINKMRKKEKGFTLVEIIVVLVILAILAAFTIPAMLGFVGDAREKANLAEARTAYIAAQSVATERIATRPSSETVATAATAAILTIQGKTGQMLDLIGTDVPGNISGVVIDDKGKVTDFVYKAGTNIYTYAAGNFVISQS